MAAKKSAKTKTTKKERDVFAGYPYAEAYEIQYHFNLDSNGKKQYEKKRGSDAFRRDDKGKKIPSLDKDNPVIDGKTGQEKKRKAAKFGQLPWGFSLRDTGKRKIWNEKGEDVEYVACRRRKKGAFERDPVWIRKDQLQTHRCLEVVFVDIGQGDGCFLVTPENKKMVIDAGQFGNMRHFLHWRYGSTPGKKDTDFEAAIISHPDADHYMGFGQLFERDNFFFETVYTNGLMEYLATDAKKKKWKKPGQSKFTSLGPVLKVDDVNLVTELVTNKVELQEFLADTKMWSNGTEKRSGNGEPKKVGKQFPTMLNEALESWKLRTKGGEEEEYVDDGKGTMGNYRMLSVEDGHMPGYGPGKTFSAYNSVGEKVGDRPFTIEVLGPVTRTFKGRPALEYFSGNVGKTKNGHSVVLRLQYGSVSMMLGGDLNIPSEHLLLSHHTGMDSPPNQKNEPAFVEAARKVFQVDIAKSCHHGSSDFTHFFLEALNPIATVISSGDKEPHSHPRSDTLGAIGRYSRSNPRPLIFSTELARSAEDNLQKPFELHAEIMKVVDSILAGKTEKQREERRQKLKDKLVTDIPRSVAVYGAITVVTDGEKVIIYQKLEKKGSHGEYDIYRLEPSGKGGKGPLMYQYKH